jgi:hypothetical protein
MIGICGASSVLLPATEHAPTILVSQQLLCHSGCESLFTKAMWKGVDAWFSDKLQAIALQPVQQPTTHVAQWYDACSCCDAA